MDSLLDIILISKYQRLQLLLDKVRRDWIDEVLKPSLHDKAAIVLELKERPGKVFNRWKNEAQERNRPDSHFASSTRIIQVYDQAQGRVLILGEPGSGKTTLLLELARDVLERKETHTQQDTPIPVVFRLSSWAKKRRPLQDWLVEELDKKYNIRAQWGRTWLNQDRFLLLLDGLDEVAPDACSACIRAINLYLEEHSLTKMVVCCRLAEYDKLKQDMYLLLDKAVELQPLTQQQIRTYLLSIGTMSEVEWIKICNDAQLLKLLSPMRLFVLKSIYQAQGKKEITAKSLREVQPDLFKHYIETVVKQHNKPSQYELSQIKHWLTWLAGSLRRDNLSEFYIESMQPEWLRTNTLRNIHQGLINGLTYGLLIGLAHWVIYTSMWWVLPDPSTKFVVSLLAALVCGLGLGFVSLLKEKPSQDNPHSAQESPLASLFSKRRHRWIGICLGAANGLTIGWLIYLFKPSVSFVFGTMFGIAFWICFEVLGPIRREIEVVKEVFSWSWRGALRGGGLALIAGLPISILFSVFEWRSLYSVYESLFVGFLISMFLICLGILIGGSSKKLERSQLRQLSRTNQGILNSLYNCLLAGIVTGLIVGLGAGTIATIVINYEHVAVHYPPLWPEYYGFLCGILGTLLAGLRNGGITCLQHSLLRFLLWCSGDIPWLYSAFLDDAFAHLLLYKTGGGYIFIHEDFLEYLASCKLVHKGLNGSMIK